MYDEVQRGWLAGDDYEQAAEAAGVVELPESGEPSPTHRNVVDDLVRDRCRWEDDNPPGLGQ